MENGLLLFDIEFHSGGNKKDLLRVFIDRSTGVTVDDCVKVSRELSTQLDISDPIKGKYSLEVSTPGLNRKIRNLDDARESIGKKVRVSSVPIDGRKNYLGLLVDVKDDTLILEDNNHRFLIPWNKVRKANIEYQF